MAGQIRGILKAGVIGLRVLISVSMALPTTLAFAAPRYVAPSFSGVRFKLAKIKGEVNIDGKNVVKDDASALEVHLLGTGRSGLTVEASCSTNYANGSSAGQTKVAKQRISAQRVEILKDQDETDGDPDLAVKRPPLGIRFYMELLHTGPEGVNCTFVATDTRMTSIPENQRRSRPITAKIVTSALPGVTRADFEPENKKSFDAELAETDLFNTSSFDVRGDLIHANVRRPVSYSNYYSNLPGMDKASERPLPTLSPSDFDIYSYRCDDKKDPQTGKAILNASGEPAFDYNCDSSELKTFKLNINEDDFQTPGYPLTAGVLIDISESMTNSFRDKGSYSNSSSSSVKSRHQLATHAASKILDGILGSGRNQGTAFVMNFGTSFIVNGELNPPVSLKQFVGRDQLNLLNDWISPSANSTGYRFGFEGGTRLYDAVFDAARRLTRGHKMQSEANQSLPELKALQEQAAANPNMSKVQMRDLAKKISELTNRGDISRNQVLFVFSDGLDSGSDGVEQWMADIKGNDKIEKLVNLLLRTKISVFGITFRNKEDADKPDALKILSQATGGIHRTVLSDSTAWDAQSSASEFATETIAKLTGQYTLTFDNTINNCQGVLVQSFDTSQLDWLHSKMMTAYAWKNIEYRQRTCDISMCATRKQKPNSLLLEKNATYSGLARDPAFPDGSRLDPDIDDCVEGRTRIQTQITAKVEDLIGKYGIYTRIKGDYNDKYILTSIFKQPGCKDEIEQEMKPKNERLFSNGPMPFPSSPRNSPRMEKEREDKRPTNGYDIGGGTRISSCLSVLRSYYDIEREVREDVAKNYRCQPENNVEKPTAPPSLAEFKRSSPRGQGSPSMLETIVMNRAIGDDCTKDKVDAIRLQYGALIARVNQGHFAKNNDQKQQQPTKTESPPQQSPAQIESAPAQATQSTSPSSKQATPNLVPSTPNPFGKSGTSEAVNPKVVTPAVVKSVEQKANDVVPKQDQPSKKDDDQKRYRKIIKR